MSEANDDQNLTGQDADSWFDATGDVLKDLTPNEVKMLRDKFHIECDRADLDEKKAMPYFRLRIATQKWVDVNRAETAMIELVKELCAPREKHRDQTTTEQSQKTLPPISEEQKGKAMAFLRDPKLLYNINAVLSIDIAGEETTRLLIFVLSSSCKTKYKQMIMVLGTSSAGKGWLILYAVEPYFPTRKRGRLTRHALDYARDIDPKQILYLQQLFSPEVPGTMILTSTSDGGYIIEYYTKDEDGKPMTDTARIPAMTVLSTTTFLNLPEEFATRIWEINADETQLQTERVLKFEDDAEKASILKILGELDESKKEVLRTAMLLLPEVDDVVLPFELRKYFPTNEVRVRRDFEKFKQLVKLIAHLHAEQRPLEEINGKKIIFALPQDVYYALVIGKEALESTMTGLEARLKEAVSIVDAILRDAGETFEEPWLTVNDLSTAMRISGNYAYKLLESLAQKKVLQKKREGRENHYFRSIAYANVLEMGIKTIDYADLRKQAETFFAGRFKLLLEALENNTKVYDPITGEEKDLYPS